MRRAIIDVGTNSVKLLVAEVGAHGVQPLLEQSHQTRLGQGFFETRCLLAETIAGTARAVGEFAGLARQEQASSIRVIGTSAARDARNQDTLALAIQQASGLALEVISGDQEAEWVFRGIATDLKLAGQRLLILDVGGGSTEFIVGAGGRHVFRSSFPLGSLRLLEQLPPQDPPSVADLARCRGWLRDFFQEQITPLLSSHLNDRGGTPTRLVGTGGTVTMLARMEGRMKDFDRARIEGMRLSRRQILAWMVQLWSLSLADRKKIVGLPPNRADVILMGLAIYEAVMEQADFAELYISTRGLRFGALLEEDPV